MTSELLTALQRPAAYPHPASGFELLETHISWVVLTGEYAYKIKKPVRLEFLDFSTLALREHFCREEVRLNRRLAPDLYWGVVPITGTPCEPLVGGAGDAIEFAVRMRQFPQDALLSRVLERGALEPGLIDQLAQAIAIFHRQIAVAPADSRFGNPDLVWKSIADTLDYLEQHAAEAQRGLELRRWCEREFWSHRDDFLARKNQGFIRECHGDMHLGNMLLLDGRVRIFDCIEFKDDFRWIDCMSEVAFVVMDLADRGRPDLSRRLLNAYLQETGDYRGLRVLRYYLVYRAAVRAEVAQIRSGQQDVTERERRRLATEAEGYLKLAAGYVQPARPLLIITRGPSGSGKTTLTQPIVEAFGAIRVRSDIERKRLAPGQPDQGSVESPESRYSAAAIERTYRQLGDLARTILQAGFSAIVDATFLRRWQRDLFRQLADDFHLPLVVLDFQTRDETCRRRIVQRATAGHDASEAGLEVLDQQLQMAEPICPGEAQHVITVDSESASAMPEMLQAIERI